MDNQIYAPPKSEISHARPQPQAISVGLKALRIWFTLLLGYPAIVLIASPILYGAGLFAAAIGIGLLVCAAAFAWRAKGRAILIAALPILLCIPLLGGVIPQASLGISLLVLLMLYSRMPADRVGA
ncbi:hypothetical protein [Lysobacter terrae]